MSRSRRILKLKRRSQHEEDKMVGKIVLSGILMIVFAFTSIAMFTAAGETHLADQPLSLVGGLCAVASLLFLCITIDLCTS